MTYSEVVEYVKTEVRAARHKRNWWREVPSERGKAADTQHGPLPRPSQHTLHHNQFANAQSGHLSRPLAAQFHYLSQFCSLPHKYFASI